MAGYSDYLEKNFSRWLVKRNKDGSGATALPTAPTTLGLSLHNGDPEGAGANELVAGTNAPGYTRVSITTDADDSSGNAVAFNVTAASGSAWGFTNKIAFTFSVATGNWNSLAAILYWGLWDSAGVGAGNFLCSGKINDPNGVIINSGTTYTVAVGTLSYTVD